HAAFARRERARPPELIFCRGHHWVHVRCGPVTRSPSSLMAWSVGFIRFVSSADATQATKVPDLFLRLDWLPLNISAFPGHTPYQRFDLRHSGLTHRVLKIASLTPRSPSDQLHQY